MTQDVSPQLEREPIRPFDRLLLEKQCGLRFSKEINILDCSYGAAVGLLSVYDHDEPFGSDETKGFCLRALLVFSTAGLDSIVKHLVRNVLHELVETSDDTKKEVIDFLSERLAKETEVIAEALIHPSQKNFLVGKFVDVLTDGSLLSKQELFKVIRSLGVDNKDIGLLDKETDGKKLTIDRIFEIRNQIVHDLDIDFSVPGQRLRKRERDEVVKWTNFILEKSEQLVIKVSSSLNQSPLVTGT